MAKVIIGNVILSGFVNLVADKRLVIGTGSYTDKGGNKVFKESVTVFLDDKFSGTIPAKGDYVKASGELAVGPRKDKPEELQVTMNLRFANQLEKAEAPKKAETADAGTAGGADGDDV